MNSTSLDDAQAVPSIGNLSPIMLEAAPRVGGHEGLMRCISTGRVYKPIIDYRGDCEASFYKLISDRATAGIAEPACFMPSFFGVWAEGGAALMDADRDVTSGGTGSGAGASSGAQDPRRPLKYMVLSDVTAGAVEPCVMDIKLGVQTFAPDASDEKAARELAKVPSAGEKAGLAFRYTGFYTARGGLVRGRCAESSSAHDLLASFLAVASVSSRALDALIDRLRAIEAWYSSQSEFCFFGTSLLLSYDAAAATRGAEYSCINANLVDFAHAWDRAAGRRVGSSKRGGRAGFPSRPPSTPTCRDAVAHDFSRGILNVILCVERLKMLRGQETGQVSTANASDSAFRSIHRDCAYEPWLD
jgi:hypothetical protein